MKRGILIVEDDKLLAESLRLNLEDHGYDVVGVTAEATQALELAERERPLVAIVDIALEGSLDGITVGAYLAEHQIAVIYMSGYFEKALKQGRDHAFDILSKTCRFEELVATIERAAQTRERQRS